MLQIEDRRAPLTDALLERNRRVCAGHGVRYVRRTEGPEGVPPYWWKVFVLLELMERHRDEVDYAMWIDSDAALVHYARMGPLEVVAWRPGFTMWLSPDAPPRFWPPFCAGVFLVRNDGAGRCLMRTWRRLYCPQRWSRDADGRWSSAGRFAGPDYEQGAFIDHLLHAARWVPRLCVLPYYVFNAVDCAHLHWRTVTVHLAGPYKDLYGETCARTGLLMLPTDPAAPVRGLGASVVPPAWWCMVLLVCCLAVWLGVRRVVHR